jgi:hypothetical protein
MSRNPHQPTAETRQQVYSLTAQGARQCDVALLLDISEKTLRLHYREELDNGAADMIAAVVKKLLEMIAAGNRSAAFFHQKCWGGEVPHAKALAEHARLVQERDAEAARVNAEYRKAKRAELSKHCGPERCIETIMRDLRFRYKLNYCNTREDLTAALKRLLPALTQRRDNVDTPAAE